MPSAPIPEPDCADTAVLAVGGAVAAERSLGCFDFGAAQAAFGLRWLGGASTPECWQTSDPAAFCLQQVSLPVGTDIQASAARGYADLLARVRGSAQPYLLRIWNFFGGINQGAGDRERYRAFCVGRAAAVDAAFHAPPPAATAIGAVDPSQGDQLWISALCGQAPGIALENPRQTPAWRYPREYGPVSPGFSRGVVLGAEQGAVLLASGTASIVGHVSLHLDDLQAQLEESLRNLAALLEEGQRRSRSRFDLQQCSALRVYLRRPEDLPPAQRVIEAALPALSEVRYLQGEVCRQELLVELEGVFPAG